MMAAGRLMLEVRRQNLKDYRTKKIDKR
ncbi:hypothetical protein FBBAL38_10829 [Flavobacteria bacterium BAL38]|nr:hypothetical protein FBBAL38_10829 [Flavobacteria bacterium BAL38]